MNLTETSWIRPSGPHTSQIGDGSTLGDDLKGWGNNELQYYRTENIEVSQVTLKIHAHQETFQDSQYTSARIRSLGLFDVDLTSETSERVRLEARIKVPAGIGLWSAFWMLNSQTEFLTWPIGGEIDILEHIGREPFKVRSFCSPFASSTDLDPVYIVCIAAAVPTWSRSEVAANVSSETCRPVSE